ncbi:MAG: hypothetical protein AB7U63_10290 [Porticoccaceae bacterium]
MNITTSFFSGKSPRERRVCIAKRAPFFRGPRADLFIPSDPWADDWKGAYRADLQLRFASSEILENYLRQIVSLTPAPILCCFESNPEECHRRVLAKYIHELMGIDVPEWRDQVSLLG